MSESKKRKKAYYSQSNNKRKCFRLEAGMKGFLITCNNQEKKAVQDGYGLLNEYADSIYGPEQKSADVNEDSPENDDDFESAIRKELQDINTQKRSTTKRFQNVETSANNIIFIKTTLERPDELVSKILSDVYETHVTKSRFILKLFPVLGTCRATMDKIEKLAVEVLEPYFKPVDDAKLTYCTIYKVRNNNLSRDDILPVIGRVAVQLNPSIRVNFDKPDFVVSVDVLQKFCCISVMTNFFLYRKYNVQEIAKLDSESNLSTKGDLSKPNEEDAAEVIVPLSVVDAAVNDHSVANEGDLADVAILLPTVEAVVNDQTQSGLINGESQSVIEDKVACVDQDTKEQVPALILSSVGNFEKPNE